ncbi:glycoside hydrolase family 9 protein [Candidatus Woesearchaeota archaeon]|nr:glycoside hydrolase family 9 protein [Candidatus Woesearchaeota archaeon]
MRIFGVCILVILAIIAWPNANAAAGDMGANELKTGELPGIIDGGLAIKSAYGFAPNILAMVFRDSGVIYANNILVGNDGPELQSGKWEVTRGNGNPIGVSDVYRRTVPTGQPYYSLGFGNYGHVNNNLLELEHSIFIVLNENLGENEALRIKGPKDMDMALAFTDRSVETPIIRVNQIGYHPGSTERWAYVSGWMGDGGSLRLGSFPSHAEVLMEDGSGNALKSVATIRLEARSSFDSDSGTEVGQINLSGLLPSEKKYRIRIPGVGISMPFFISEQEAYKAFYATARGLFHNRWAGDLRPEFTGWSRPQDLHNVYKADISHSNGFFPENTPTDNKITLMGGYHDAGDFDQRTVHTVVPMLLMRAYEISPEYFHDSQLNIPESNNGIPDLLDEALWGIRAWEQLQESNGCVRPGVESYKHPNGIYFAHQDELPYWTYSCDPRHTARAAALFAQAARLLRPFNNDMSENLKSRAVMAYNYSLASNTSGGPMLYASGELYRLTGSQEYREKFENVFNGMGKWNGAFDHFASSLPWGSSYNMEVQPATSDYLLGYLAAGSIDAGIHNLSKRRFNEFAAEILDEVRNSHAHRSPRSTSQNTDWGKGTALGEFLIPIYSLYYLGETPEGKSQEYFNAMSLTSDYILGANPDGIVYITGLGLKSPQEPLHLDSLSFIKQGKGPIPGIPVFGPVGKLPDVYYYEPGKAAFYPRFDDTPLMLRYADIRTFANTNEFDVTLQAIHAQFFALLQSLGQEMVSSSRIPEISGVMLSSTDYLDRTNGTLTGFWQPGSLKNSIITNETKWYNNSMEAGQFANSSIITPDNTNKHDRWIFSVRVYDGLNWSAWKNSTALAIKNARPIIRGSRELDVRVRETQAVNISVNAFDLDNDPLKFSINSTLFSREGSAFIWVTNTSSSGSYCFNATVSDNEDTDSFVVCVAIADEADTDSDEIPDFRDTDDDNDGVNDNADYLRGGAGSIKSFAPLSIRINGSADLGGIFNGTHNLVMSEGAEPILEFNWTFNERNVLDLGRINITRTDRGSGAIIISGIDLSGSNSKKTAYIGKINATARSVCIKDMDNLTFGNFTSACAGTAETLVICNGTAQGNYTCLDIGGRYRISGLSHSAVREQCRDNDGDGYGHGCSAGSDCNDNSVSESTSCGSGSSDGGGSESSSGGGRSSNDRGSSSIRLSTGFTYFCSTEWQCSEWSACTNGLQMRSCSLAQILSYTQDSPCPASSEPPTSRSCTMQAKEEKIRQENVKSGANANIKKYPEQQIISNPGKTAAKTPKAIPKSEPRAESAIIIVLILVIEITSILSAYFYFRSPPGGLNKHKKQKIVQKKRRRKNGQ